MTIDTIEVHQPLLHARAAVGIVQADYLGEISRREESGERDLEHVTGAAHGSPRNPLSAVKSVS